jgi:ABC-type sugar transport system substrate-binding protein
MRMKYKKGSLPVVVVLCLAALVGGNVARASKTTHGSGPLAGKNFIFSIVGVDPFQLAEDAWVTKLIEAQGGKVQIVNGNNNPDTQTNDLENAIVQQPAGIILQPVDVRAESAIIRKIMAAKIPLVLFGEPPSGITVPLVKIDDRTASYAAGQAAARFAQKHFPGQPPRVVLFTILENQFCNAPPKGGRMRAFLEGMRSVAPNTQVVFNQDVSATDFNAPVAKTKMQNLLVKDPNFNVFAACAGEWALGGISALQAAGRAKAVNKVPKSEWILAYDGTPQQIALLTDPSSSLMAVIALAPKEDGMDLVKLLTEELTGKISRTSNTVIPVSGRLLPSSCAQISAILKSEYGVSPTYKAVKCNS